MELTGLASFLGFALGLLAWTVLNGIASVQEAAEEQDEVYSTGPLFTAALPFVQALGRFFERLKGLEGFRGHIDLKLIRAGKADAITPDEFLGLMTLTGGAGALISLYFELALGAGPFFIMVIVLLVGLLPYLSLDDSIKRRQAKVRKILPYTLDLLTLSVEAGLDFSAALNRIAEKLDKNPLQVEVKRLNRDLSMGKTRSEALRDMDHRIGLEELTTVVSALIQADELGASLGPTLRIQSKELQRKRFQRAEKKAMQAPVLMLVPLVLFIFPLVFLIIFTPILLKVLEQGIL